MESIKIYSMIYDNSERGNNGLGEFLGEFRKVKQLREDTYVDDFIGVNAETGEVCVILSEEVCGIGGGIRYEVVPIPGYEDYLQTRVEKLEIYPAEAIIIGFDLGNMRLDNLQHMVNMIESKFPNNVVAAIPNCCSITSCSKAVLENMISAISEIIEKL